MELREKLQENFLSFPMLIIKVLLQFRWIFSPHNCRWCIVRELFIDWYSIVVKCWSLEDNTGSSHQYRKCEDPEEQAVQNHSHVLPILFDFHRVFEHSRVLRNETYTKARPMKLRWAMEMWISRVLHDGTFNAIRRLCHRRWINI